MLDFWLFTHSFSIQWSQWGTNRTQLGISWVFCSEAAACFGGFYFLLFLIFSENKLLPAFHVCFADINLIKPVEQRVFSLSAGKKQRATFNTQRGCSSATKQQLWIRALCCCCCCFLLHIKCGSSVVLFSRDMGAQHLFFAFTPVVITLMSAVGHLQILHHNHC